jgi:hypothetical protein
MKYPNIKWPFGKSFAFSIFDDTDNQTEFNTRPVYDLLAEQGIRTTKSVWPIKGALVPEIGGDTCENPDYLRWVLELKKEGFEIGMHNATFHTSQRQDTLHAFQRFEQVFGQNPIVLANHGGCNESIYWGNERVTGIYRSIYKLANFGRKDTKFYGHKKESSLFWGDVCKDRVKYVRNFIYNEINTLKSCPVMPYHDPIRPYVNYWFASSDGHDCQMFNSLLSEKNQDSLVQEGGACIVYTHFASGFYKSGKLDQRFKELIYRISKLDGWFAPVSSLLDYLLEIPGRPQFTPRIRRKLERKWIIKKILDGGPR